MYWFGPRYGLVLNLPTTHHITQTGDDKLAELMKTNEWKFRVGPKNGFFLAVFFLYFIVLRICIFVICLSPSILCVDGTSHSIHRDRDIVLKCAKNL